MASTASTNPPTFIAASSSTALSTATVSGLVPNTTYFLFVNACAAGTCSSYTALSSTITLANAPALPSTFSNVSAVGLTISFGANNNPTGTSYTVQISTSPIFVPILNSSITVLTQATFTGLAPNTTYYLHALATNFAGTSSVFTNLGSTTTATAAPPTVGTILATSTSTITAAWNLSIGATGYTLVASTTSTNPPTFVAASSSTALSTATVAGLVPNTTYFLFVNACASGVCSSYTALGSTITLANAPGLPGTFSNVSPVSLTISFGANNNPAGTSYTVQISTNPTFTPILNSSVTLLTQATFTGLAPSTTYYLQALATNFAGTPSAFTNLGIDDNSSHCAAHGWNNPGHYDQHHHGSLESLGRSDRLHLGRVDHFNESPNDYCRVHQHGSEHRNGFGTDSEHDLLLVRECVRLSGLLDVHGARFHHHAG